VAFLELRVNATSVMPATPASVAMFNNKLAVCPCLKAARVLLTFSASDVRSASLAKI
jgi:hypothetical protein